jgi:hypothetical protein
LIDIFVPVLGRKQAIAPLMASILDSTSVEWRVLFLCSPRDDATSTCVEFDELDPERITTFVMGWEPGPADWAKKINWAYRRMTAPFFLMGATDLKFHPRWDTEALHVAETTGAGVIGTNDLGNATVMRGHHSTHPLIRRSYADEYGTIDEDGKILHEGYQHQWVDTELCETAKARGQWAFAKDSHVEHLHFMWGKSKRDATYDKALSTTTEDHRHFGQRRRLWQPRSSLLAR